MAKSTRGPSNWEDRRPGRSANPWDSHEKRFSLERRKEAGRAYFASPATSPRFNDGSDEPTPARKENSKSDSLVILSLHRIIVIVFPFHSYRCLPSFSTLIKHPPSPTLPLPSRHTTINNKPGRDSNTFLRDNRE